MFGKPKKWVVMQVPVEFAEAIEEKARKTNKKKKDLLLDMSKQIFKQPKNKRRRPL